MEQTDTTELLRECNSGIKMGIDSIDEMLPDVKSEKLRAVMLQAKKEHCDLGDDSQGYILAQDGGKARSGQVRRNGSRSHNRRLRYGHQVTEQLS